MAPWLRLLVPTVVTKPLTLVEFPSAYLAFDHIDNAVPLIVQFVGSREKITAFQSWPSIEAEPSSDTVQLHHVRGLHVPMLLLDCPVPGYTRPKTPFMTGKTHSIQHLIKGQKSTCNFSPRVGMYASLSALCHLIVVFVDDFPGESNVIELLSSWIRSGKHDPRARSRLLLISNSFHGKQEVRKSFLDRLFRYMARVQQMADPTRPYTRKDMEYMYMECFESVLFSSEGDNFQFITTHASEVRERRINSGWGFDGITLPRLFRGLITHISEEPSKPLDHISVIRAQDHEQKDFGLHITAFLQLTHTSEHKDACRHIASALYLDAFPPNAHHFFADQLYRHTFKSIVEGACIKASAPSLAPTIESHFYEIDLYVQERRLTALEHHCFILQTMNPFWASHLSQSSCLTCMARQPHKVLECGHRLCTRCIRVFGAPSDLEPWQFWISRCPLCHSLNTNPVVLRPQTAAPRWLILKGGLQHKRIVGDFLRDLQSAMGISQHSLCEHFERIYAEDIGVYYVLNIFVRHWTISKCIRNISNVTSFRFKRKLLDKYGRGRITFDDDSQWSFSDVRAYGDAELQVSHLGRHVSNSHFGRDSSVLQKSDVPYTTIQYEGDPYENEHIVSLSNQLISALFYIELVPMSRLFIPPQRCRFIVRCQIPAGPPATCLIKKLSRARLFHRIDQGPYLSRSLLSTKPGSNFPVIMLEVQMASRESHLDVGLEIEGRRYSISNCPYRLESLIKDQGLENIWTPHTSLVGGSGESVVTYDTTCTEGGLERCSLDSEMSLLRQTMHQVARFGLGS